MNVVLIGSVSSSAAALEALIGAGVEVTCVAGLDESAAAVVSDFRPLRPIAEGAGIPYLPIAKVTEPRVVHFLGEHPADLLWVIGLSQLVPQSLVQLARGGGVGFHPTMLPRGRGRAPVAWTILLGERAAVSLFFLTDQPDAGDIIAQREVPVLPHDYAEDLIARTNEVLADVIVELAPRIRSGDLPRRPQDHSKATYYGRRTPADGLIHWSNPTDRVYRLVRAAGRPYPGAFTYVGDRKVTIRRALPADEDREIGPAGRLHPSGTIIRHDADRGVLVRTGDGGLWLGEIEGAALDDMALGARCTTCRSTDRG